MFHAGIIYASFSYSVQESGAATASSRLSSARHPRHAFRTRADIRHRVAFTSVVPDEDIVMTYVGDEEESAPSPPVKRACRLSLSPPSKRPRLSPSTTARDATATLLWRASAFDRLADRDKDSLRATLASEAVIVSVSGFGYNFSGWVEETPTNRIKFERLIEEVRLLCVGAPGGRSWKKRSLEENFL